MKHTESPLAGSTLPNWARLLRDNGGFERKYWLRALFVTAAALAFLPFRIAQAVRFGRRIRATRIDKAPVFLIGHYRSGTTYLQNLVTQDRQFGFVSTTQAVLPGGFLLGRGVRALLGLFLPESRPMDGMQQSPTLPEEPEHAIANLSPYAFYHGLCFPRRMMHYFERYVLFEGAEAGAVDAWKAAYQEVLQAATLAWGGRRLMIKNPPDTARIPQILSMFPDARFIFLYRNPFVMFPSIRNFYSSSIRDWQLQDIDEEVLVDNLFSIYERMHRRYQADKGRIPDGHLVEVRFEDLEHSPLEVMRRIYTDLGLEDFEAAEPAFAAYVESQARYRKNAYILDDDTIERISERWGAEIERWGYQLPPEMRGDRSSGA